MAKPTIGRIVHVMTQVNEHRHIRPAIIVTVGPTKVDEPDTDQCGLFIFAAPGDIMRYVYNSHESPAAGEWLVGSWRWPPREPSGSPKDEKFK
jgi:hypothetical protein